MKETPLPSFDLIRNWNRVRDETLAAINIVLEGQHFILGPEVEALEKDLAAYLGTPFTVGCASGTDALLLALMALDLGPGDEVITTPFSFFATASCITRLGATPVFADVNPDSYNIDPQEVLRKITPKTKAVIPVHLFGQMARVEEFAPRLEEQGIRIVEDCAQAIGSTRIVGGKIQRAGTMGELGCFSFFPTKNLGCFGDGGMISVSSEGLNKRLRSLRAHGSGEQYFHDEIGLNSRLDELQAAILRVRFRHLETWNEERRLVAERYRILLAEQDLGEWVIPPLEEKGNRHIYHQYVLRCRSRDLLKEYLAERGIATRVYYPLSLHLQPCFSYLGYARGDMPLSERLTEEVLALPVFPELEPEEQERVVQAISDFYGGR
jgi:dTDP-4-amino-4,6-dideoxygalactose transaminase